LNDGLFQGPIPIIVKKNWWGGGTQKKLDQDTQLQNQDCYPESPEYKTGTKCRDITQISALLRKKKMSKNTKHLKLHIK
jgi:hypothetical protein